MSKTLSLSAWGETYRLSTRISNYRNNGNLYIGLVDEDGCPYCDLTVNIDDLPEEDMAAVDTNNCPWAEKFIEDNELGEKTPFTFRSGFCVYPIYIFDMEKVKEYI